jgi:hypothetical protein
MFIKCISKTGKPLPQALLNERSGFARETEFDLIESKEYVVYAMTIEMGYIWYYICDESYGYFPIWQPSPLFQVISGKMSRYWIFAFYPETERYRSQISWAYPEWANNPYQYYDRLSDGEEEEVKIFKKYKALMDVEFPIPSNTCVAEALDETWLMCPYCIDAWESISKEGMVICPKCKTMMHNPRFVSS